ncbi:unnamed protein product [Bursaphelenchus xylophilus]|uniref:(pine wood nematode) hypothetical protein n=1 Tax=Bursaphelenchus xylophilus TaxID=6326 RepID=A0A1I7S015_BURXY|nr:unnamed protein product [Bursaphelenchus xylophilus]CAG9109086.1 unnamed protein product [Bursaphelenchus xylophilus]
MILRIKSIPILLFVISLPVCDGFVNPVFNRTIKPTGEYFTTHILAHFHDFDNWYHKENKTFRDIYEEATNQTLLEEDAQPFFDRIFKGLKDAAPELRSFKLHVNNMVFDRQVNSTDEDEVIAKLRAIQQLFRDHITTIVTSANRYNLHIEAYDTYARVMSACEEGNTAPGCRSRLVLDKAFPDHEWHDDDYRLDTMQRIGNTKGIIQMIYHGGDIPLDVGNHVTGDTIHHLLPTGMALTCDELQGKERHMGTHADRKVYAEALNKIKEEVSSLQSFTLVCERTVDLNETSEIENILEMRSAVAKVDQEIKSIIEEALKVGVHIEHIYEHINFFTPGCAEEMLVTRCNRELQLPKAFPDIPLDNTLFTKVFKRDLFHGVPRHLRIL